MRTAPSRAARSWLPPILVVASSLIILAVVNPWLLLQASTPAGGDMGAHVYGPDYLRDVLLPSGRIQGWSMEWFAGFPLYYFYFPLPSLAIVLLDLFLPYGVAFKLVTVAGLVGLPPAIFFSIRSLRFPSVVAAIAASGGVAFALMESFSIYGANVASTLAGEFAFSWSFSLGFVYLGLLIRAVRGERRLVPWAAVVFALAALSHVLTTIVLVLASLVVLAWKKGVERAVPIWAWAAGLTGFWSLPFVVRIAYSTDMAWTPLSRWEEVFPVELWLLIPPAVAGAVWALRRSAEVFPLIVATVLPVIYYPLPVFLRETVPGLVGEARFKLWNGRLLPYWYFGVVLFAALALGGLVLWASRRLPARISVWWPRAFATLVGVVGLGLVVASDELPGWAALVVAAVVIVGLVASMLWRSLVSTQSVLAAVAASVMALGALSGVTFIDGWARWNYSGYEGKETWEEYRAFMETVDQLPPGRVQWEFNSELDKYGTTMSLMLIPFWTGPEHPSMEGLFFESSLTVPFHFLNQAEMSLAPSRPVPGLSYRTFDFDRGIPHLQLYGIRYYAAYTDEAKQKADADERLTRVAESPPFVLYEVADTPLVEPLTHQVGVYQPGEEGEGFGEFALDWYDDVDNLDQVVVADGPEDWPQVGSLADLNALQPLGGSGEVSDLVVEDHRISFRTEAVGVPHLVKVSYFPNWTATGAEGPYRATPSLMVVVPTAEEVTLEFGRTWVEWFGILLTVASLAPLVGWWVLRQPESGDEADDEQVSAASPLASTRR